MNSATEKFFLDSPVGRLECALDLPSQAATGVALVAHPHPLYGGTMDNKVVHTLVRAFIDSGYATFRMNFRGVGQSAGTHDHGSGETSDMLLLHAYARQRFPQLPLALAGFSFGAFVQASLLKQLPAGEKADPLILVGTPAGKWDMPPIPPEAVLIHGENDETIALGAVFTWLNTLSPPNPVIVLPGTDHFFHQRLVQLRQVLVQQIKLRREGRSA